MSLPDAPADTPDDFNLGLVFQTIAETVPDRECVVSRRRRLSYAQLLERARRLASFLHDRGVGLHHERAGLAGHESGQDHVGLALFNGSEYFEGMIGGYLARAAPFNVNYRYVGEELRYLLTDARPRALVFDGSLSAVVQEVVDEVPSLDLLIQIADDSDAPLLDGAIDYEDALASADPSGPSLQPSPDDLYILYTGGTTGMPKGVLWRQHDIFIAAMGGRRLGTWETLAGYTDLAGSAANGPGIRLLLLPPLMHGAAQWAAYMMFCNGATIVFPENPRRLDPADVWQTVERERCNTITVVGDAMVRPLLHELNRVSYDTSSLFAMGNGGAPLTPAVRSLLHERLPNLLISDSAGSSETGAQMFQLPSDEGEAPRFRPGPGTVVVNETMDQVLDPGHEGLGWLAQTGEVPLGYLGDPDKTARTFPVIDGVRYAVPGDRARSLADGEIELLGRDAVTINSGGEKIFAEEVERAIAGHPEVLDVVVAGRPSERWGQEVIAVVQLRAGAQAGEKEIVRHASQSIARYKLPKAVRFVPSVQRSPSGKADYRWARQMASDG